MSCAIVKLVNLWCMRLEAHVNLMEKVVYTYTCVLEMKVVYTYTDVLEMKVPQNSDFRNISLLL